MNTRYEGTDETASAYTADIVVVGTGIHGIHLLSRITDDPELRHRVIWTVDPADDPCAVWLQRTKNCGMRYLRSPASHGLNARLPRIRRFARERNAGDAFIPPYHRPALSLFNEHIRDETARIDRHRSHLTGRVTAIDGNGDNYALSIATRTGETESITARAVILALGNPPPHIPKPFEPVHRSDWSKQSTSGHLPKLPIYHVYDTKFDIEAIPPGARVAIVGGGIAGAHLALNLHRRGAVVDIWNRDPFYPAQFDSDPCFIGPRCGEVFRELPITQRRERISASRRRGSVPPDLFASLMEAHKQCDINIRSAEVRTVDSRDTPRPGVTLSGRALTGESLTREYDTVVLSTGFAPGPPAAALVAETAARLHLPLASDMFPVVDTDLAWNVETTGAAEPDTPQIFCTGALAELELGPPARNIIGAHLAGRRIIPALRRRFTIRKSR